MKDQSELYKKNLENSYLYGGNASFVESLYEDYLAYPSSVSPAWRRYFDTLKRQNGSSRAEIAHAPIQQQLIEQSKRKSSVAVPAAPRTGMDTDAARKQAAVLRLIHAYRLLGHHRANVDPIMLRALPFIPDLDPHYHGLTDADMDATFNTGTLVGPAEASLKHIIGVLKDTYAGHIASEYMHITDIEQKNWIMQRLEGSRAQPQLSKDVKKHILERLTAAEGIERYLHTKYSGQKRFSLEGGEGLIPMMDELIRVSGSQKVKEVVIAMAHRGRLNVLVNVMGKRPSDLFSEFEGQQKKDANSRTGDVKYHQGFSSDVRTPGGNVHLALAFNPSHLEIVDPVAEGSTRARQDRRKDKERETVLAILIHGDAAIAGQGVVYETLNLSQTRGYTTGGSIHLVVNNRIGFTTSHPLDTRSTLYCTDIGKVIQAPIFHVNGDDPEALLFVCQLAWDFRTRFKKDVIIDIICYRRHGHNEADEPAATQPMMYRKVRKSQTTREVYANRLVEQGTVTAEEANALIEDYRRALDEDRPVLENLVPNEDTQHPYVELWRPYVNTHWSSDEETAVPVADLKRLGALATTYPDDFELHPRVVKVVDDRRKAVQGALPMDWGTAETLAYASLLDDGFAVRITGQDSRRGTFFHRHAALYNQRNGETYLPLQHLSSEQPRFDIVDSILSEEAVLGFEYGYSTTTPLTLVVWEAQYGDFTNGAQVVIDQFISSSEQKWGMLSGLVMMLPHGWEGQGPEHSSARLERFIQLCAQENIQVCAPTTPAQMFHVLRRQMVRNYRKPLILMSPKSLLRRKISYSSLEHLSSGGFEVVVGEVDEMKNDEVVRVIICSGKVYFDLLERRREENINNQAIIRLEQIYPFPASELKEQLDRYPNVKDVIWTQEEPQNQGAWYAVQHAVRECMKPNVPLRYSGRKASAAPAGGDYQRHMARQKRLVNVALGIESDKSVILPSYELYAQTTWDDTHRSAE